MKTRFIITTMLIISLCLACDDDSSSDNNTNNLNNTNNTNNLNNANNTNNLNNTNNTNNNQVTPECAALVEGYNENFMVNGTPRAFYLKVPTGTAPASGWAVLFAWHGTGDTAVNFKGLVEPNSDNQTLPYIAVTPDNDPYYTMNALPPTGIDWDILNATDGAADADLYDAVLTCLYQRYPVDTTHIHTLGFSAGSIMADLLAQLRNDEIASVFTYSGAYLNNPDNTADLQPAMAASYVHWPAFASTNKYTQVIIHGADGDATCEGPQGCDKYTVPLGTFGTFVANFNHMGINDAAFLPENGHDVIHCEHALGHTNGGPTIQAAIQFFADHPLGTADSPYSDTLPTLFSPDICTFIPKQ